MDKVNTDKLKKHLKLVSDITPNRDDGIPATFDGYMIHESLVDWALNNISTKKLKQLIKQERA